eukprot:749901-Hanusia_phi.AAC.2
MRKGMIAPNNPNLVSNKVPLAIETVLGDMAVIAPPKFLKLRSLATQRESRKLEDRQLTFRSGRGRRASSPDVPATNPLESSLPFWPGAANQDGDRKRGAEEYQHRLLLLLMLTLLD